MQWSRQQLSILAIVAITSFMGTFLISSINIALPAIEAEFSMHAVALSWIVTGFLLTTAILLLSMGRIADLSGVRRVFKSGLVLFTLSSLLCAYAPKRSWRIAFRQLQRMRAALDLTAGTAI